MTSYWPGHYACASSAFVSQLSTRVIFVHGLFGGPKKTWTGERQRRPRAPSRVEWDHASSPQSPRPESVSAPRHRTPLDNPPSELKSVFWPKDLLPNALPAAAVFSWGYDANAAKFMGSVSLNTVYQHARNPLNDVSSLRKTPSYEKLPMIFVAHSLGGLVVKDALNQAAGEVNHKRLESILMATAGICFLGTPHHGSNSASVGRRMFRTTEFLAAQSTNTQLMQALEKNSETIERTTSSFYGALKRHNTLRIFSFSEEKEVRILGLISSVIVDRDSAWIGHSNEEIGTIPADHRQMAKFTSNRDTGFVRIKNLLAQWVSEIYSGTTRKFLTPCPFR